MARMSISRTGLELIESFEGFRARAARLPDANYTIGFGHTQFARDGIVIDRLEAEDLLRWDLRPVEDAVRQNVHAPITQNQFDALVSLAFNIGTENFLKSEVLRHINAGEPIAAATAMGAWRCAVLNGTTTIVDALVRRRAAEAALFLEPDGNRPPAPTPVVVPTNDNQARRVRDTDTVVATDGNGVIVSPFPVGDAYSARASVAKAAMHAPTITANAPATDGEVTDDEASFVLEPLLSVEDETVAGIGDADTGLEELLPVADGQDFTNPTLEGLVPANDSPTSEPVNTPVPSAPQTPLTGSAAINDRIRRNIQDFPSTGELNYETVEQEPVQARPANGNGNTVINPTPANDVPFGRRKEPLTPIPPRVVQSGAVGGGATASVEDGDPTIARTVNQVLTGAGAMALILGLWRAATEGLLNRPTDAPTLSAAESTPLLAVAVGFVLLVVGLLGLAGDKKDT